MAIDIERMEAQLAENRRRLRAGLPVEPISFSARVDDRKLPVPKPVFTSIVDKKRIDLTVIPEQLTEVTNEGVFARVLRFEKVRPNCVECKVVAFKEPVKIEDNNIQVQVPRGRKFELRSFDPFWIFQPPTKAAKDLLKNVIDVFTPKREK